MALHPTPYLWTVYPTNLAGNFKITLQGSILEGEKPAWKFWGSAYDFIYALKKEIPEVVHLLIPANRKILPDQIAKLLFEEGDKIGVKTIENNYLDRNSYEFEREEEPPSKVPDQEGGYGAEDLKNDAIDPSTHSKLTDGGHQTFQVSLGSRVDRIIKIALHVIKTPKDENPDNDIDKTWSVVPDEPSKDDEKEGVKYFRTRDEGAAWVNKKEEDKDSIYVDLAVGCP